MGKTEKTNKKKFFCPECGIRVNPNNKVITIAETEAKKRFLVLQSEKYGDYKFIADPDCAIKDGEKLTHYCPSCNKDLAAPEKEGCSRLLVNENEKYGIIYFANDNGKQATYIKWADGKKSNFGKDRQSFFAGYNLHENNFEDHDAARMG